MKDNDLVLVGLGNPGDQYRDNRHNVGFLIIDEMAKRWNSSVDREKWNALYGSLLVRERRVHLVRPMTYMNLSGKAVAQYYSFYKIEPAQLLVIHDDLDMAPGRIKLVKGGGAGGHNGIKSIASSLGGTEFYRLKVGIGRPGQGEVHKDFPVEKYVLGDLCKEEADVLEARYDDIEKGLLFVAENEPSKAMNILNSLK